MSKRAKKPETPSTTRHHHIHEQIAAILDDGGADVVDRLTALVCAESLQASRLGYNDGVRRFIAPVPNGSDAPDMLGTLNLETVGAQIVAVAAENGIRPGSPQYCTLIGNTIGRLLKINRDAFVAVLAEERHRLVRIMELNPHVDCAAQVRTIDVVQGLVANGMLPVNLIAIPEPEQGKP